MVEVNIGDVHFPFHDPDAWELALALVREIQPDIVYLGGDIFDFYQTSKFLKDPSRGPHLQDDIDIGTHELKRLRRLAPNARFIFREGNHEVRLQKYIFTHAAPVASLRSLNLAQNIGLKEIESEFLDSNAEFKLGKLWHMHGDTVKASGTYPAKSIFRALNSNVVVNHFHKFDYHGQKDLADQPHRVYVNACLCDLKPDYLRHNQWEHGVSVIDYAQSGEFYVHQVRFMPENGRLTARLLGVRIRARKGVLKAA